MAAESQIVSARERAKHFIICDSCFWCASFIQARFLGSCPSCRSRRLSRMQVYAP
ncbi:MAG: hypothetical protein QXJ74_05145 [Nitrososphaera sp.]